MTVVDLGAAPGGWSQVAADLVGDKGLVLASDILPMDGLAGVEFIQGDFTETEVLERLLAALGERRAAFAVSDRAPEMCGLVAVDQPKAVCLVGLGREWAQAGVKPAGDLVAK